MKKIAFSSDSFWSELSTFCQTADTPDFIVETVRDLLADVKKRGNLAVIEHTERLDGPLFTESELRVPQADMDAALEDLEPVCREAIESSIENVRSFHEKGLPKSWVGQNSHGATVGERFYPIQRVGLYIPAGQAPLASTIVMTSVLAKLAGVSSIAAFTPPNKEGKIDSNLLATFKLCGVDEVYCFGGVLAVGAMAYGTDTIESVCKVYGPGNAFVNEAKRQVIGQIGIDILAGPSEVMIITDETADATFVAADILAQAEHDPRAKLYLISHSDAFAKEVCDAVDAQKVSLSHQSNIKGSLRDGFIVIFSDSIDEIVDIANYVAPEHLELQMVDETVDLLSERITTAGAIFQGHYTPTVVGDFAAGPNHTLPTMRSGRFYSGLQISDFLRRSSITRYNKEQLSEASPVIRAFSSMEQLDAHGESMEIRFRS